MSNDVKIFSCDKKFSDSHLKDFINTLFYVEELLVEYEDFKDQLELFFNDQLTSDDLGKFDAPMFELSDASNSISFPFCIKENKLKFLETDAWRSTILSAIALSKLQLIRQEIDKKVLNVQQYPELQL